MEPRSPRDLDIAEALRRGDEAAFERMVLAWSTPMQRVALAYVHDEGLAADVVQETWLAVLEGIDGFEGKSSLRHWVYRILINHARTRFTKEARTVPMSSVLPGGEPAVEPSAFLPPDDPEWPGHWAAPPARWDQHPERCAESIETLRVIEAAIRGLPEAQAQVMVMRDIAQLSSEEVSGLLALSPGNQRVLLHRARARVRRALERYFGGEAP